MNVSDLFLVCKDKDGGEWTIAIQDRPKDIDGFRELARERMKEYGWAAVEIREHTSRLIEVVDQ